MSPHHPRDKQKV